MQLALHNVPLALVLAGYLGGIACWRAVSAASLDPRQNAGGARRAVWAAALYAVTALLIHPPTRDVVLPANARTWAIYGVNVYCPAPDVRDSSRIAALSSDDYINHLPYTYGPAGC
jgi:uncharacterized membrane protein